AHALDVRLVAAGGGMILAGCYVNERHGAAVVERRDRQLTVVGRDSDAAADGEARPNGSVGDVQYVGATARIGAHAIGKVMFAERLERTGTTQPERDLATSVVRVLGIED